MQEQARSLKSGDYEVNIRAIIRAFNGYRGTGHRAKV